MKPMRIIQKNPGLKIVVQSLINALLDIFNLILISFAFIALSGILGVNLFKG